MPKSVFNKDYQFLPHSELLSFEEIEKIAAVFVKLYFVKRQLVFLDERSVGGGVLHGHSEDLDAGLVQGRHGFIQYQQLRRRNQPLGQQYPLALATGIWLIHQRGATAGLRFSASRADVAPGRSGLGTQIVQSLVQDLRGRITWEPAQPRGTRVRFVARLRPLTREGSL